VLAAVLAVIGYSLNDTIVIFDRIRENMLQDAPQVHRGGHERLAQPDAVAHHHDRRDDAAGAARALFPRRRGDSGFSIALIIGVLVGTYSSIYIASATALALKVTTTGPDAAAAEGRRIRRGAIF
jgi:preprotein translocase subunit SecF